MVISQLHSLRLHVGLGCILRTLNERVGTLEDLGSALENSGQGWLHVERRTNPSPRVQAAWLTGCTQSHQSSPPVHSVTALPAGSGNAATVKVSRLVSRWSDVAIIRRMNGIIFPFQFFYNEQVVQMHAERCFHSFKKQIHFLYDIFSESSLLSPSSLSSPTT